MTDVIDPGYEAEGRAAMAELDAADDDGQLATEWAKCAVCGDPCETPAAPGEELLCEACSQRCEQEKTQSAERVKRETAKAKMEEEEAATVALLADAQCEVQRLDIEFRAAKKRRDSLGEHLAELRARLAGPDPWDDEGFGSIAVSDDDDDEAGNDYAGESEQLHCPECDWRGSIESCYVLDSDGRHKCPLCDYRFPFDHGDNGAARNLERQLAELDTGCQVAAFISPRLAHRFAEAGLPKLGDVAGFAMQYPPDDAFTHIRGVGAEKSRKVHEGITAWMVEKSIMPEALTEWLRTRREVK